MGKLISLSVSLLISFSAIAQEWKPLNKTCDAVANTAASEHLGMQPTEFDLLSDEKGMEYLKNILTYQSFYKAFLVYISSSINIAEKTTRLSLMELMRRMCKKEAVSSDLAKILPDLRECLKAEFQDISSAGGYYKYDSGQFDADELDQLKKVRMALDLMCSALNVPGNNCNSRIVTLIKGFNDSGVGSSAVTIPHEFGKLSSKADFISLSAKLALHLLDLTEEAHFSRKTKNDIFQDLIKFISAEGYSEKNSRDLAFLILGTYGTRGASFIRMQTEMHPKVYSMLVILSSMMSYLDKIASLNGTHYALPAELKTTCTLGKPYHFWMAAYLSYYSQQQGFSQAESYYAPIISGVGYDIIGNQNGRNIKRLFEVKKPYSYYSNMTRLDNWSRTLGSHFGSNLGHFKVTDGDALLGQLFSLARAPRRTPAEFQQFHEYVYMIQPEVIIKRLAP